MKLKQFKKELLSCWKLTFIYRTYELIKLMLQGEIGIKNAK